MTRFVTVLIERCAGLVSRRSDPVACFDCRRAVSAGISSDLLDVTTRPTTGTSVAHTCAGYDEDSFDFDLIEFPLLFDFLVARTSWLRLHCRHLIMKTARDVHLDPGGWGNVGL